MGSASLPSNSLTDHAAESYLYNSCESDPDQSGITLAKGSMITEHHYLAMVTVDHDFVVLVHVGVRCPARQSHNQSALHFRAPLRAPRRNTSYN